MNEVGTIRDKARIKAVVREAAKMGTGPHLLALLGFNTGLRISDLLQLRVRDVRGEYIIHREQKTRKTTWIEINPSAKLELMQMTARRGEDELLFPSPQIHKRGQPVDYVTAYRWINTASRRAGVEGPVGCHTMRKTFGYHYYYESGGDVAMLMKRFNHSDQSVTLHYIGVTHDKINTIARKMRLG